MQQIHISISDQTLSLLDNNKVVKSYSISSALNGVGENSGSGCTPTGNHYIRAKIGDGSPINSVFIGRRATGEIYTPSLAQANPNRDWILSRILWLSGLDIGYNRLKNSGGSVDSMSRYIYIHGTPDTEPMGIPKSHGCIRMRNADVIEVFDWALKACPVLIDA